jgi:CRP/FNR family transcriptional regulator, cyclic AMP receptor protein
MQFGLAAERAEYGARPSVARKSWPAGSFAQRLPAADLHAFCALGRRVPFLAGTPLMSEGEPPDSVLLMISGLAKVVISDGAGTDHLLGVRGPGELLGEMGCVDKQPRSARIVALSPIWAWKVPARAFTAFLLSHPTVGIEVMSQLAVRLRNADRHRIELSSREVGPRLARAIRDMALVFRAAWGGPTVEIPLSQDELAQLINAAQVSVQRALRDLRGRDLVRTGYRKVTVPCLACLELLVDPGTTVGRNAGTNAITGCGGASIHHSR